MNLKSLKLKSSAIQLSKLANEELNSQLKALVQQERELLSEILRHIAEVDSRKLYLKMAYPNLFTYLTEHLGYSAGSAQRRIDAARLLNEVPALAEKLESGDLNLSQVSVVQKAIRQKSKEARVSVSQEEKQNLFESLSGQSYEATQKIVAQVFDVQIQQAAQVRHQKDSSVRFEITLSQEQWQKLLKMREVLSTSLPNGSWDQVLEHVADKIINSKAPRSSEAPKPSKSPSAPEAPRSPNSPRPIEALKSECVLKILRNPEAHCPKPKGLGANAKKRILQRDGCCQFIDPRTQKKCASKWNLHIDHIRPRWAGGGHESENLRVLCGRHNLQSYRDQSGLKTCRPIQ